MNEVEWRPVVGFPGYSVSNMGFVRNDTTARILSRTPNRYGYLTVGLRRDRKAHCASIHRLVLLSFVGPAPDGMQAAHNDGDRGNEALSNLRWATPSENNLDKLRHGTIQRGEKSAVAKLRAEQIPAILADPRPPHLVARDYGVSRGAIDAVRRGKAWCWVSGRTFERVESRNRFSAFGEVKGLRQWAADPRCKTTYAALRQRVTKGWPLEQAIAAEPNTHRNNQ